MRKKKKHRGHWCKVCGTVKANESFTGKGHRNHTCKKCAKLPYEKRLEMQHIGTVLSLPNTKKGRRQLHLFISGKKYSEKTKEVARNQLEWFSEMENQAHELEFDHWLDTDSYDEEYNDDWLDDEEIPF